MNVKKLQKQSGFTIIEVLIVLAIAGLIMLVVFLAVPALQRNARNNSRNNEAARLAAAITECMSNNNGKKSACDSFSSGDKLQSYYDVDNNQQLTDANFSTSTPDINTANVVFGRKCDDTGTGSESGGGSRAFAVVYGIETGAADTTRCIAG